MTPSAMDALFDAEGSDFPLRGGEALVTAGEPVRGLYRLRAGRIAEIASSDDGGSQLIAVHRPGAILGGAEILTGRPYATTLTALRDSEFDALDAPRAKAVLHSDPDVLSDVARAALTGLGPRTAPQSRGGSILGFVAVCDSVAMRQLVEELALDMRALGARVAVIGSEAIDCAPGHLSRLEADHDFILMAAERGEPDFTDFCGRQIDRLILVGGAESPLPDGPVPFAALAIRRHRLLDFILVQPVGALRPCNSDRWLSAAPASRLFHVRLGNRQDFARLARVYLGRSVGLVLSGGGARAYAHVGAVRALREIGVPIDFVAGTSMGAVIAAGVAMDWPDEELDERIQQAFVRSSPLADIAFPLLAMTRGLQVDRRLEDHFGDVEIADLWRPFTCVSTNLTSGALHAHRRGLLRRAVRASLSLPGVLPPVVEDGQVLVDGALVRNLPADLVREQHEGATIGVDVSQSAGLQPDDLRLQPSGLRWLTSGAWRRGPPIVSVLIRSATMPTAPAMEATRNTLDIAILPLLDGVELRDWRAYAPAVEAGYRAALGQAEALTKLC